MSKFNSLSYFNMRALFMGIGIAKILTVAKEYTFSSILIGSVLGYLFLLFYKNRRNKNFINIIVSSSYIILGLIILINMISSHYLSEMPKVIIGIPLLLLMLYMCNKSNKVLIRLGNILIVFNLIFYLFSIVSLIPQIDVSNYSFTGTKFINVLYGSLIYFILSVSPTLLLDTNDKLTKTYFVSSITLGIWLFITYSILGSDLVNILRYPEYVILKNVSLGGIFENVENIVSFMWMIDVIVLLFTSIISLKKNIKDIRYLYLIILIIYIITSIFNYSFSLLNYVYNYAIIIVSSLFFLSILSNKKTR